MTNFCLFVLGVFGENISKKGLGTDHRTIPPLLTQYSGYQKTIERGQSDTQECRDLLNNKTRSEKCDGNYVCPTSFFAYTNLIHLDKDGTFCNSSLTVGRWCVYELHRGTLLQDYTTSTLRDPYTENPRKFKQNHLCLRSYVLTYVSN